jgi:hypothetical protein
MRQWPPSVQCTKWLEAVERIKGLSYAIACEIMQKDSDDMNVCVGVGWRCFRSTAAISMNPLSSGLGALRLTKKYRRSQNERWVAIFVTIHHSSVNRSIIESYRI